jgi:queuine tRNA-ribosyltransferase
MLQIHSSKMATFTEINVTGKHTRSGILHTRRGDILTPTFMPDGTRGVVKSLTAEQVKSAGIDIVLANTYHLHLQPGEEVIAKLGGLHEFGKWQGPILTDSGGFQVFSLSKLRKITEEGVTFKHPVTGEMRFISPEISMQIQLKLGADMIVAFDHLTGLDEKSIKDTKEAYDRTHRWLLRCVTEFKRLTKDMKPNERPMLFGVVQGGLDLDLRAKSLKYVQDSDVDGIAIGGLSVGEPREEMYKVLAHLAPLYDPTRPRFLLGVGDPRDLRYAIEHGIDMLDCVLPTRNARHATVWRHCSKPPRSHKDSPCEVLIDEKVHLTNAQYVDDKEPIEPGCDCYTCASNYSKGFLRHQFKVSEPLAGSLCSIHNLRYLQRICEGYRTSI